MPKKFDSFIQSVVSLWTKSKSVLIDNLLLSGRLCENKFEVILNKHLTLRLNLSNAEYHRSYYTLVLSNAVLLKIGSGVYEKHSLLRSMWARPYYSVNSVSVYEGIHCSHWCLCSVMSKLLCPCVPWSIYSNRICSLISEILFPRFIKSGTFRPLFFVNIFIWKASHDIFLFQ